jgi:serine-type D-Ala-D-Ala carboxypeptidase (penicillin-binding protein 5/6)
MVAVTLAATLVAFVLVERIATTPTPPLVVHRTLSAYIRFPGSSPRLQWPREGQAAVEVEGVGSAGTSGDTSPTPIASVAKVMTAYLTLREHPLAPGEQGFTIRITPAEVAEQEQRTAAGQSTLAVRAGERITERQALEALMLPSANNIAALLASHGAGGTAGFVRRMNLTARGLGMRASTYTDPSGFDDTTVSSAVDQLKLARVAMHEPAFASIVDESSASLPVVGQVANYDDLIGHDGYVGVKTGSDRAAGGCFVFAKRVVVGARRLTVLGVVLGQREGPLIEAALVSAQRLGDSLAAALRRETVLPAGTRVLTASASDGRQTSAATAHPLSLVGWGGLALPVRVLTRPTITRLNAGEQMATVAVGRSHFAATDAVATRAVAGPSLGWRVQHAL